MQRSRLSAYRTFRQAGQYDFPRPRREKKAIAQTRIDSNFAYAVPIQPLAPYQRCGCGVCRECLENERWDRIFEKFAAKEPREERGLFQCALNDL